MYLNLISLEYTAKTHGIESGQIFKCWAYLQDCEIRNPTAQKKKETNKKKQKQQQQKKWVVHLNLNPFSLCVSDAIAKVSPHLSYSQIPGPLCRLRKGVSFCSVSLQLLSKSSPSVQ